MSFFETGDATFNSNLEKINPTDMVHVDIPNKRFEQLINNNVALKNQLDTHNHDGTYADINHKHNEYLEKKELEASLTGVAKESSEKFIENTVKNIETQVGNINSGITENLQGVAKERTKYIIEDKIKILENDVKAIKTSLESRSSIIKSIQKGSFSMPSNKTSQTVTISRINPEKAIILIDGFRTEFNTQYYSYSFYLTLLRHTQFTIAATTGSSLKTCYSDCSWQVIDKEDSLCIDM